MSLIKDPEMTDKNLEAHRSNGRKSRGAATPEGKERSRAANLRHGYYSELREEALAALGEDPAVLAALVAGAYEEWQPASGQQAWMVERLARLQWRMERAERIQCSLAAHQVQLKEESRQAQVLAAAEDTCDRFEALDVLRSAVARPDYYTPRGYFRIYCEAFEEGMTCGQEEILDLLHALRKPPKGEGLAAVAAPPGAGPSGEETAEEVGIEGEVKPLTDEEWEEKAEVGGSVGEVTPFSDEEWEKARAREDEDDYPLPEPHRPVARGAEREALRQKLLGDLTFALECLRSGWKRKVEKYGRPLTAIERDVAMADLPPQAELMRREEQACAREFWRLGNSLRKLQERAGNQAENGGWNGVRPTHVQPNGVRAGRAEGAGGGYDVGARHGVPVQVGPNSVRPGASAAGHYKIKNEGASGDVDENTVSRKITSMTDCAESVAEEQFQEGKLTEPATEGDAQVAKEGARAKSEPAERATRAASAD